MGVGRNRVFRPLSCHLEILIQTLRFKPAFHCLRACQRQALVVFVCAFAVGITRNQNHPFAFLADDIGGLLQFGIGFGFQFGFVEIKQYIRRQIDLDVEA